MNIRSRIITLCLFGVLLLVAGKIATGGFGFLLVAFWFNAGILTLLLAALVDQPFYSTDSDIMLNGMAAAVSLVGVRQEDRETVWWTFLLLAGYLVISSASLMYRRSAGRPMGSAARAIQGLNAKLGRPTPLFSVLFLWGVLKSFGIGSQQSNVLLLYWALFIAFDLIGLGKAIDGMFRPRDHASDRNLGIVRTALAPGLLEVEFLLGAPVQRGQLVIVGRSASAPCSVGVVVSDRALVGSRIGRIAMDGGPDDWAEGRSDPKAALGVFVPGPEIASDVRRAFVGIVEAETDILTLRTIVMPDVELQQGELLWTWVDGKRKVRAFYQIVAGSVRDTRVGEGEGYRSVLVQAQQLGIWEPALRRFEPVTWVARANAPVYRADSPDFPEAAAMTSDRAKVGLIPNSTFPVHVGLQDIVTHNTAILGVTGSGKSWLAFGLIEELVASKIKVLILDITRQHWLYLERHNPTQIKTTGDLDGWLADETSFLGVNQFATETGSLPRATAMFADALFTKLKDSTTLKAGVDVPAKVCLVLEEAHSLIPEWNQVASDGDRSEVNRTARTLLQGRKYGMGALIITQRTANVTKTILNQCNTVFAMQSFDQTGLDFLRNYMGEGYAQSISTLPVRHCVVVGKGSSSTRPVICHVTNMGQKWGPEAASA